jgi:hypothetical protein
MATIPRLAIWSSTYPPDRYRNALMTAAGFQVDPTNDFFSIYNNDTLGRYLYLYGVEVTAQTAGVQPLDAFAGQGKQTGGTDVKTVPVKLDEAITAGVATSGPGTGFTSSFQLHTIGSNAVGFYHWPYSFPAIILPPGFSYGISTHTSGATFSFSFQWYMGEPLDYRPILTQDVADWLE